MAAAASSLQRYRLPSDKPGTLLMVCGVVLPLVALVVESIWRLSAQAFFDPLPTFLHALLVALVPAVNLASWGAAFKGEDKHVHRLLQANACIAGIAAFYALLYMPLVPIGLIAVVAYGLGLLPLAPLLSLIAALRLRTHLKRCSGDARKPVQLWPGMLLGVSLLLALEVPATLTRIGMQMAVAESPATRSHGLRLLRAVGSEEVMLRLCYVRTGSATDLLSFLIELNRPLHADDARTIYYRVTGVPFNSRPVPVTHDTASFGNFDRDQGALIVGSRLQGLSLVSSRLDGSLDGNAALGYLEWTLVFKNDTDVQREARAQIALPPGAVASRLTLWINGEEREAAFAGRGSVQRAYQNIVRQSRDPALLTTAGQDRIALQLFPVPPRGEMKVRVGVTAPLDLRNAYEGVLRLPYFHERNFELAPGLRHSLWMDSKSPLRSTLATSSTAQSTVRAELDDSRLALGAPTIAVEREERASAWTLDREDREYLIRQTPSESATRAPSRLVVVLDGSAGMRAAAPGIAAALATLPDDMELKLVLAGDESFEESTAPLNAALLAARVKQADYGGGIDNTAALARGLDLASLPGSALLWIHGPQPVLLHTQESLLQRLQRRGHRPDWYDLQVQPGVNLIGEGLEKSAASTVLCADDLQPLVAGWARKTRQLVMQRERIKVVDAGKLFESEQTSQHLARLWANDEIARLSLSAQAPQHEAAIGLAQRYQLVTAISGAVVLENQAQYTSAGLEPVPPGTVPTIPEPETWALLIVVMLVLAYSYRQRVLRRA